ncbi:MAG: hypothetical protein KGI00_01310 [Candidatus Micrarchaeota archaeon]|nr:hypothetical protein [Candidatus Micrarchaeota archaeon]MDE1849347.1 hypothetical protein [Candidatus Micrarchaeota archaeon]
MAAAQKNINSGIFVGVYMSDDNQRSFYVYAGRRKDFKERMHYAPFEKLPLGAAKTLTLASLKRVPKPWREDIERHVDVSGMGIAKMGYILYNDEHDMVRSTTYYPRDELVNGSAERISYYIEALAVRQIQLQGTMRVATSYDPSDKRIEQLERVGLLIHGPMEIRDWLRGLGRGIREQMEKA